MLSGFFVDNNASKGNVSARLTPLFLIHSTGFKVSIFHRLGSKLGFVGPRSQERDS